MTGNQLRAQWRQIAFDDVQVGTANPAGNDAQQQVSWLELGTGNVLDLKKGLCC